MERVFFEFVVRSVLIAVAAEVVLRTLRIKVAAAQHSVWVGVLGAMLVLPVWISWGPKAALPLLPARGEVIVEPASAPAVSVAEPAPVMPVEISGEPVATPVVWNWSALWMGIYLMGAGALLLRLAIGTVRANRLTGAACAAPVTVGLLRPRVILPENWNTWPPEQLDAVLTHERAHARRRDPLFQWLALFHRAVFWFHPLAWWLERRISALAEEACDAAVLERGHDPRDYSEYLIELARAVQNAGRRVNVVAMAMPGSYLPQRVKRMLDGVRAPRVSPLRMACAILACAIPGMVFAAGTLDHVRQVLPLPPLPAWPLPRPPVLLAQAPAPVQTAPAGPVAKLEFEVASVRPFAPDSSGGFPLRMEGGPGTSDPGRIRYVNLTFKSLLMEAYGLGNYSIAGPAWLDTERYVIEATIPAGATKEQVNRMLQNLLSERFQMTLHRETRDELLHELTFVRKGPKLKESLEDSKDSETLLPAKGFAAVFGFREEKDGFLRVPAGRAFPGNLPQTWMEGAQIHAVRGNQPISGLVEYLSFVLKSPVVDKTGLKGNWDYNLEFAPSADASSDPAPDIVGAVRDQLGLKLEKKKGPVELLTIDRVEKTPTEN